ncbi:MAG TPA: DUF3035 domain-containing protein [Rhizomicrobium sp.]|nr:DUF3035 domain-containing protein [Rhizomicrobium sp.]
MMFGRVAPVLLCAAALAGCQSLRESAGLTKSSPDEFAVTTKAKLVIPPGFNLMPPTPGAAPLNTPDSDTAAQTAMFGGDAATVASNITGNYSTAERMLLANAGINRADPTIRQRLQADRPGMQSADADFTARLLGSRSTPNNGQPINADAEVERRRGAAAAAPKKSSGGWFDWF